MITGRGWLIEKADDDQRRRTAAIPRRATGDPLPFVRTSRVGRD